MKLIAHRGGSFGKENSLSTIIASARMGADAVECDIRKTKDGVYVIYHDESLTRLAGVDTTVSGVTYDEMKGILANNGQGLITFDELANGYTEDVPILLHIKLTEYDEAFAKYIAKSGLPIIAGVQSIDMLKCFSSLFPPERILAFLPKADDAKDYYRGGAGIIRLWEQWLGEVTPDDIKATCPGAEVYVMACNMAKEAWEGIPLESMDGSREGLDKCAKLNADGVLLNNIDMAVEWRRNYKN